MHTHDGDIPSGFLAIAVSLPDPCPKSTPTASPRQDLKPQPRPRSSSAHPASPRALRTTANHRVHRPFNCLRAKRAHVLPTGFELPGISLSRTDPFMTYRGLSPTVKLVRKIYHKGVSQTKEAMKQIQNNLNRTTDLEPWFITIRP